MSCVGDRLKSNDLTKTRLMVPRELIQNGLVIFATGIARPLFFVVFLYSRTYITVFILTGLHAQLNENDILPANQKQCSLLLFFEGSRLYNPNYTSIVRTLCINQVVFLLV